MNETLYQQWMARQETTMSNRAREREYHRQAQVAVARKAQTVVDHPGWQTFLDHLGAIQEARMAERERTLEEMTDAIGEALQTLQLRVKALDGELKGLKVAVELIPTLITQGQSDTDKP